MTASQRRAVLALLVTPSVPAAARAAGLSSQTLHRWLRDSAIRAELERHRDSELVITLRQVQASSGPALEVLLKGMRQRNRRARESAVRDALGLAFEDGPASRPREP